MDQFLVELLLGIVELLLELAGEAILDLALRGIAEVLADSEISSPVLASFGYGLLGVMTGGLSLLVFPHPLVHPSRIHGISLLVNPVIAGVVMSLIGSMLRKRDQKVVQIESFGYGFAFAFGMALLRFFFAK
jgi:hypothetical protein